jgi:hypothetical protein
MKWLTTFLRNKLYRRLSILILMLAFFGFLISNPSDASTIIFCFHCGPEYHFSPPGGDSGVTCTGACACYSGVNDSISLITDSPVAAAWCQNHRVMNWVKTGNNEGNMQGYANSVSMGTGLVIVWSFAALGCDPGDVPFVLGEEDFSNCDPPPCPTRCVPYQSLDAGLCADPVDYCSLESGCGVGFTDGGSGCCCTPTPILIDIAGDGIKLTDSYAGVNFDFGADGHTDVTAWTAAGSDDAWLALDRNGNGQIDNAKELFGNFTDQPHASTTRNGFVALAEFDRVEHGGNVDNQITNADQVFSSLRLWRDENHNGISEPGELHTLTEMDLATLEFDYKESKKTDEFGNQLRYRAKVKDTNGAKVGRWAWDVILNVNPAPQNSK